MVEKQGWNYFRVRERELLDELISRDNLVVATGGGAIMHRQEWHLAVNGNMDLTEIVTEIVYFLQGQKTN